MEMITALIWRRSKKWSEEDRKIEKNKEGLGEGVVFCSTQHPNIGRLLIHKQSQRHTQQIQRNTFKWLRKFCAICKNQYLYMLPILEWLCAFPYILSYVLIRHIFRCAQWTNVIIYLNFTVPCYEMNCWACLGRIVQSLMRFGSWSGPTQSPNMDVLGVAGLISSDNITAQTPHTNQVHDDSKWRRCGLLNVGFNMQNAIMQPVLEI